MDQGIELSANSMKALAKLATEHEDYITARLKPMRVENVGGVKVTFLHDSQRDGEYEIGYLVLGGEAVRL